MKSVFFGTLLLISFVYFTSSSYAQTLFELLARTNSQNGFHLTASSSFDQDAPVLRDDGVTLAALVSAGSDQAGLWDSTHDTIDRATNDVLFTSLAFSTDGSVIFNQLNSGGTSDGVFSCDPNTQTITQLIAPGGSNDLQEFGGIHQASDGTIGFRTANQNDQHSLFTFKNGQFTRIATESTIDASSHFQYLFEPRMSDSGVIASKVLFANGKSGVHVWGPNGESTDLTLSISDLDNGLGLSDDGTKISLTARLANNDPVLLLWDKGKVYELVHITASAGTGLPTDVKSIGAFNSEVNDQGQVIFRGTSRDGKSAIFLASLNAEGKPQLTRIIAHGDTVTTDLGKAIISTTDPTEESFIGGVAINNAGQIAFKVSLISATDPTLEWGEGLFRFKLP